MDINKMDVQLNQNLNTGNISTDEFLAVFTTQSPGLTTNHLIKNFSQATSLLSPSSSSANNSSFSSSSFPTSLSTTSTSSTLVELSPPLVTVDHEVKLPNLLDSSLSVGSTFNANSFNDTLLFLNSNFLNNSNYSLAISPGSTSSITNYSTDQYQYFNQTYNTTDSNITEVVWDGRYPSGYTLTHIIIASVIVTILMIIIVVGNMLVIIAIATEKSLKNIQNWFIASLAVADFFLGLIIMPFSLANELMGYWIFGSWWCDIHSAMDVLLCTASIMNLCLISLDRYWSITKAVDYLKSRTPARAAVMIAAVWIMSALICIPPLLGWKVKLPEGPLPKCALSENIGYVVYSALGSFYIPSCIMVFVYIRIYFAAKARARRGIKKHPRKMNNEQVTSFTTISKKGTIPMPTSGNSASLKSHQLRQIATIETPPNSATLPMQIPTVTCDLASDISTSEAGELEPQPIIYPNATVGLTLQSPDTLQVSASGIAGKAGLNVTVPPSMAAEALHSSATRNGNGNSNSNGTSTGNGIGLVTETSMGNITAITTTSATCLSVGSLKTTLASSGANENNASNELRVSPLAGRCRALSVGVDTDMVSEFDPSSSDSGVVSRCAVVKPLKFRFCQPIFGKKSNQRREEAKAAAAGAAHPEKAQEIVKAELEPAIPKLQKPRDPEKEKRRIARKKEKRATLILGLIMGSFIACWLPFFFLYILVPACGDYCHIPDSAFAIAFWLGYMNSALNPAIYTIFNKDFRRAFRRILFK